MKKYNKDGKEVDKPDVYDDWKNGNFNFNLEEDYKCQIYHNAKTPKQMAETNKKLQAFKDYVHKRLDDAGIEKEPDGEHSKHGCRIGDRLDIVFERIKELEKHKEVVELLSDWSNKYPRGRIYPKSKMRMDDELIEIENKAKELVQLKTKTDK